MTSAHPADPAITTSTALGAKPSELPTSETRPTSAITSTSDRIIIVEMPQNATSHRNHASHVETYHTSMVEARLLLVNVVWCALNPGGALGLAFSLLLGNLVARVSASTLLALAAVSAITSLTLLTTPPLLNPHIFPSSTTSSSILLLIIIVSAASLLVRIVCHVAFPLASTSLRRASTVLCSNAPTRQRLLAASSLVIPIGAGLTLFAAFARPLWVVAPWQVLAAGGSPLASAAPSILLAAACLLIVAIVQWFVAKVIRDTVIGDTVIGEVIGDKVIGDTLVPAKAQLLQGKNDDDDVITKELEEGMAELVARQFLSKVKGSCSTGRHCCSRSTDEGDRSACAPSFCDLCGWAFLSTVILVVEAVILAIGVHLVAPTSGSSFYWPPLVSLLALHLVLQRFIITTATVTNKSLLDASLSFLHVSTSHDSSPLALASALLIDVALGWIAGGAAAAQAFLLDIVPSHAASPRLSAWLLYQQTCLAVACSLALIAFGQAVAFSTLQHMLAPTPPAANSRPLPSPSSKRPAPSKASASLL